MNIKKKPGDSKAAGYVERPTRTLAAIALLALGGCTTTTRLAPIDRQSTVAFVVVSSPPAQGAAAVHDTNVRRGASSGMKIGSVAGALAGLMCGPLAIICVPAGAMEGGFAGSIAGAAVGLSSKLPKDTVAQLNDRLKSLQQSHDPMILLRTDVLDQARTHWEITDDTSNRAVTLEVQGLSLTSTSRKKIALEMQVLVHTNADMPTSNSRRVTERRFEFVSKASSLEAWLDERGSVPEDSLRSACQQIATEVISELAAS